MINKLNIDNKKILIIGILGFFIQFFYTCSLNNKMLKSIDKINKIDSIVTTKPYVSKNELDSIVKTNSFMFLIYEDDLDKGKTSLSDIKNKIDSKK